MRKYTLLLLLLLVLPLRAQETSDRHITQTRSILPCPMQLTSGSGSYLFTSRTTFAVAECRTSQSGTLFQLFIHPICRIYAETCYQ